MTTNAGDIRRRIIRKRAALADWQIAESAHQIAGRINTLGCLHRAKHIAFYQSVRGEVDCTALIEAAVLRKKRVFLPVLRDAGLSFAPIKDGANMRPNRFGILEPVYQSSDLKSGRELDVVFAPLVAFDKACNRIGMGGGYYDRAFAFKKRRKVWRRPLLIGLAYDFQQIEQIAAQPWDVALDGVVTETEVFGLTR